MSEWSPRKKEEVWQMFTAELMRLPDIAALVFKKWQIVCDAKDIKALLEEIECERNQTIEDELALAKKRPARQVAHTRKVGELRRMYIDPEKTCEKIEDLKRIQNKKHYIRKTK